MGAFEYHSRFLGDYVVLYPRLTPICGGVTATVFFCYLLGWHGKQHDPDGWIYKSRADIERETGLTRWEYDGAREALVSRGLLAMRRGQRSRLYFQLQESVFERLLAEAGVAPADDVASVPDTEDEPLGGEVTRWESHRVENPPGGKTSGHSEEKPPSLTIQPQHTTPTSPAPARAREDQRLWDAFVAVLEATPTTKTERGRWNGWLKELRLADPPVTPEEVPRLVEIWDAAYSVPCTPGSIAGKLSTLRGFAERGRSDHGRRHTGEARGAGRGGAAAGGGLRGGPDTASDYDALLGIGGRDPA